ncbi:putative replisome organizer protein C-terminus [Caudoviricetes sp.]|nr:putative replisome organizer protein C-terminus [Caudoviricetes sp.]UOF81539.1 putative replisome organizer protein C-terminus [Caudoviricetes sp.]
MPTDPKWRVIARRSGRPLSEVLAVFVFMMANAGSNSSERGALLRWSDEDVAAALDVDGEHVVAIREAMEGKTIEDGRLTGWEKRQPKREDNSAERVSAWRAKKKREERDTKQHETRLERNVTQCNAPETETDTDTDTDKSSSLRSEETRAERAAIANEAGQAFERFWDVWPNKAGKPVAAKAFFKVWREADAIIAGVNRYIRDKPADRPWLNPSTFLRQRRWEDQPAPVANARAGPGGEKSGVAKLLAEAYGIDQRDGTQAQGDPSDFRALSVPHGGERVENHGDDGGVFGRLLIGDGG